ncbi:MAG TPA: hypothetical protein VFR33_02310 [Candidatus Dormibacteraeota bacterium]|nr:hypothetical protein [Candidatus Dormibacteraeota bacterium]
MHARIPLDVDLEDKLIYGLTPIRLTYFVIGLLAAFATWSQHWAPPPVRAPAALLIGAVGAIAAWGRWRGRAIDNWTVDLAVYIAATYCVKLHLPKRH